MTGLVDTHAHIMDRAFDVDRDVVLERAREAGVSVMLLVGYDLATSRAAVELTQRITGAKASVGIHPNSAAEHTEADFDELRELAHAPEVIAIGETGLDYYRQYTPHARQRWALDWHAALADELHKPLVIHNRDADADIAAALSGGARGVLHCFSSSDPGYLDRMVDAGWFVSFAGTLTYNSADDLRAMVPRVPKERLLVETDCPYLTPQPKRGQRNEPAFVRFTAERLALEVGMTCDALASCLWQNTRTLFPELV
jgi:TatD DNase family protein